ncbi:MAG: glutamyl-tRNA reductase [Thermomicrobiales bacterium]
MALSTPSIVVVGSNHEYASVDIRERLAFVGDTLNDGLRALNLHVDEGLILSTCNRTEIYVASNSPTHGHREIFEFLSTYHNVPLHVLERASYAFEGNEAVEHLFRVASGLDSMVLGEPQILSQIRDALSSARDAKSVGPMLQRLATDALRIGKRARTETDISRNRMSIAHAALDLINVELNDLGSKTAVIIGAGKMSTLAAKLLTARGIGRIIVVNRSLPAAQTLASQVGGGAIPMSGIAHALDGADLVIAAVASEHKVVTPEVLRPRQKPLLLVDLSVPRTIDTACEVVDGVSVRDVDVLESLAEAARFAFASEVSKVEVLVQSAVEDFGVWTRSRVASRAIGDIQHRSARMRDAELDRALRKLAHLSDRDLNIVRALASGITNKILHDPITALRQAESLTHVQEIATAMGVEIEIDDQTHVSPVLVTSGE